MRNLLEQTLLRQLELVEILHISGAMKIETLAEQLQLSGKTVAKDLTDVRSFITPAEIVNNSQGLYSLYIPESCSIDYLYAMFLFQSTRISLLETIFFEENLSYRELSEKLFLSESTLKRTIASMNDVLIEYDIQIATRPFRLTGNEPAIENLFIILFTEKYRIPSKAFPAGKQAVTEQMLRYWMNQNQIELNYPDLNKIILWMLVALHRKRSEFSPETVNPNVVTGAESLELYDREIQSAFHINFKMAPDNEKLWKSIQQIFKNGYVLRYDLLEKACEDFLPNRETLECTRAILDFVSAELDVPVQNYEKLTIDLFNLINLARNLKLSQFILNNKRKRFFLDSTEPEKALFFVLVKALKEIQIKDYQWKESDIYELFYILTTHWSNLLPALRERVVKCRVGLFFDTDIEHAQYIKRLLLLRYSDQVDVSIISALSLIEFQKKVQDFDLVITNLTQNTPVFPKILCISPMPTNEDWFRIRRRIREIR